MGRPKGRGKTTYINLDALKSLGLDENASADEINQKIINLSAQVTTDLNVKLNELLEVNKRLEQELFPIIPNAVLDPRTREILNFWIKPYIKTFSMSLGLYLKKTFWLYAKHNNFLKNKTMLSLVPQEQVNKLQEEIKKEFDYE